MCSVPTPRPDMARMMSLAPTEEDEAWLTELVGDAPLPRPVGHKHGPQPEVKPTP